MAGPLQITVQPDAYADLGAQDPQDVIEQLMQMRRDAGAPDQTTNEIVDWRFPNKAETFTTRQDPRQEEFDQRLKDFIDLVEMRARPATPGSAQESINTRYPVVDWHDPKAEMTPAMNIEPESDDEAYRGVDSIGLQHFWRNLPKMTSEVGAAAWMADPNPGSGFSQNVEDRRNQSSYEVARGAMQWMAPQGEDLSGLSPQEYINQVIGGMHHNDLYYGPGAEDYHLVPGMAPRDFDQADFYPMRKISR